MPSGQIRAIIVSGKPHFHRGLINVRIWIKINILTSHWLLFASAQSATFQMNKAPPVWGRVCSIKRCGEACDI